MTSSKPRFGLLLLMALGIALGVGFYLFQQEQRLSLGIWPDLPLEAVQSVEVVTRKDQYILVREPSGWVARLAGAETDNPPVPADPARIEALLSAIARSRPNQQLDPAEAVDAAALGFNDPAVRLVLRTMGPADGKEIVLLLGRETPTGAALYASSSLSPGAVYLLDASILQHLDKPAVHYFDERLLDVRGEDVLRLTLQGAHGVQWDLERRDDVFVFLAPTAMQGSSLTASEVRLFVHNITAITADAILAKPDRQGAGKPVCAIEIQLPKQPAPMRLELFAPLDADLVLGRSTRHPAGFQLEREKAKSLIRLAYDMQWRGVVSFDSSRVEGARVYSSYSNQTLVVEKGPAGWVERDTGRAVQGIDMTLWRLKEMRFEAEPVSKLGYPAVQRLEFDLTGKDGRLLSKFTFFTDPRLPADQCWLKVGADEMFYPVTSQLLEDVQGYLPVRQGKTP